MDRQFKVGDKVTFRIGGLYSTYAKMAKLMKYPDAASSFDEGEYNLECKARKLCHTYNQSSIAVIKARHHKGLNGIISTKTPNDDIIVVLEFADKFRILVNGDYLTLVL